MSDLGLRSVNYVYFLVLFVVLAFIHAYGIILIETSKPLYYAFYVTYSALQCFLEIGALFLLASYCLKKSWRLGHQMIIGGSFFLFLLHVVDFPLVRFMDLSIWYALNFMSDESLDNFIEMLYAANFSLKTWGLIGCAALTLPFIAALVFHVTRWVGKKRPWEPSLHYGGITLGITLGLLCLLDYQGRIYLEAEDQSSFLKGLPWKKALFTGALPTLKLPSQLKMPLQQEAPVVPQLAKKPNVFLFIIESVRRDFVTEEVAPHLTQFRKEYTEFDLALSSANVTVTSWFSLFHSKYPFYWGAVKREGSLPLQILKEAGYQTHFYSSARLSFYEMNRSILGKDEALADSLHIFPHEGPNTAHISDALTFEHLNHDLHRYEKEEGHLFVVFLDSTHFGYSWPKEMGSPFTPIVEEIDYLNVIHSKENLEGIKNRYRNALHYVDALFGSFYSQLMKSASGSDSVVIVTADHGEEFYEEGNIFHATHLSSMQTEVPLYYKFGSKRVEPNARFTTHLDIFPSLLHYLFGDDRFAPLFDGESIFREKTKPFAIAARYNARRPPFEFLIHNGVEKLVARFEDESDIFAAKSLKIIARKGEHGEALACDEEEVRKEFGEALDVLFPEK